MPIPEDDAPRGDASVPHTRKSRRLASLLAVFGLIGGALLAGQFLPLPPLGGPPSAPMHRSAELEDPSRLAPALEQQTAANMLDLEFATLDSKRVNLASFIGRPTILNFWASWCAPCVKELPELDALAARHAKGDLRVVAVSLNATPAEAQDWLRTRKLTHLLPVMDAGGKQLAKLGASGLPVTLLIREDGSLAERLDGFRDWDSAEMKEKLEGLLGK